MGREERKREIVRDILSEVARRPGSNPTGPIQKLHGVSRETVRTHLMRLCREGFLIPEGERKSRVYYPGRPHPDAGRSANLVISRAELEKAGEDVIVRDVVSPFLTGKVNPGLMERIKYFASEILNNAIDHSEATRVELSIVLLDREAEIEIADDGVGAFETIKRYFSLKDHFEAVGELAKGKRTTDPTRHAGEGIFFSARFADKFSLSANGISYVYSEEAADWTIMEDRKGHGGTLVAASFRLDDERTTRDVFEKYTVDYEFTLRSPRLVSPYTITLPEGSFPSRSEARKILAGAERFESIVIDFKDVDSIGQGFADEVFRVFANEHPGVSLEVKNAKPFVARMIAHVKARS